MRKVIIITDCIDVALLEMRGAIYSNTTKTDFVIEPIVKVDEYSIINTAFLLDLIVNAYPDGSIVSVVVNPVQKRTERIIAKLHMKNIIIEGTNTGAFGRVLEKYGCDELYEIHDNGFVPFGGKFVHAPTVGKVLSGKSLAEIGSVFDINRVRTTPNNSGLVLHKDNFGNIKFIGDLGNAMNGDQYEITVSGENCVAIYWERMMECDDKQIVIYPGSSFGFPEIGIVRGDFASKYNVHVGDVIYQEKKENPYE